MYHLATLKSLIKQDFEYVAQHRFISQTIGIFSSNLKPRKQNFARSKEHPRKETCHISHVAIARPLQLQSLKCEATATLPSEEESLSLHKHRTAQICNSIRLHSCIIRIKNVTFDSDIEISDFLANFATSNTNLLLQMLM